MADELIVFDLTGIEEMDRVLRDLGPRIARQVAGRSVKAGAEVVAERARELAPKDTEALADSITVVKGRRAQSDEVLYNIGFEPPTSRRAHLTEFGAEGSPAKPFMRPAMDEKAGAALDAMGEKMAQGMEREAAKLAGERRSRRR